LVVTSHTLRQPSPRAACLTASISADPTPRPSCQEFSERLGALPLEEYLSEIRFYYSVREMLDRLEEIWDDYLNR